MTSKYRTPEQIEELKRIIAPVMHSDTYQKMKEKLRITMTAVSVIAVVAFTIICSFLSKGQPDSKIFSIVFTGSVLVQAILICLFMLYKRIANRPLSAELNRTLNDNELDLLASRTPINIEKFGVIKLKLIQHKSVTVEQVLSYLQSESIAFDSENQNFERELSESAKRVIALEP